jgi:exosortase E/protease (VPEID-CTERM system)
MFRNELRFPQTLVLLPIGIVTIWLCNALRIATLVLIGTYLSPEIAVGGFHSQAGWIGFVVVTIAIAAIALRSPVFARHEPKPAQADVARPRDSAAAYLVPLLAMIAVSMITSAFSRGFDPLYPVKIIVGVAVLCYFARVYKSLPWSWSWIAAANGVVVFAIWLLLEPLSHIYGLQLAEGLASLSPQWKAVWLVFRVFGSVAVVPLAEEITFRGYLMRRITSINFDTISYRQASWLAVFVSSVLFGLMHGRWIAGTAAGICYAIAARRRNMLCDALVAHGVTNVMIAIYVLLTDSWQLWA